MEKHYYVTTPIYYANGDPHLGSGYTTIIADTLTRFYRQRGYDSFFLTGTDEHGDKVEQAAIAAGTTAQAFTDEVSHRFRSAWDNLKLGYSRFIRTTEPQHKQFVREILQKIYDQGDIYFGEYTGNYCVGCERFLTERELVDGKRPDHQTTPQPFQEKNYFFRMAKYQDRLVEHITTISPNFIRPERYKNEVLAMLREPIGDLCISRPKSRLTWGIELPFDSDYVTYVWFDALLNYLTGINYPTGDGALQYWGGCEHLVGKDIIKPHGIFWPTMLMAAGIPLYQHLSVHGYWVTPTGKMSKSLGNVVYPEAVAKKYGMDPFRYFLLREMTFGLDATFSEEGLEARYNSDLANNLGNLVSRSIAMLYKYRDGVVPTPGKETELEEGLRGLALETGAYIEEAVRSVEFHRALEKLWLLIDAANVYIDRTKPWSLAKAESSSAEAKSALDTALYTQIELLRFVSELLQPFLPDSADKITGWIGAHSEKSSIGKLWGVTPPGLKIQKGETLFPRIEVTSMDTPKAASATKSTTSPATGAAAVETRLIAYEDFAKVQLRVGQILAAEKVEKSEKLLKLSVDIGEGHPRQVIAGIAKHYEADTLIGKKIVVVANLKPAKLMGLESQGMLLAGSDSNGNLELISPGEILTPGSTVK